MKSQKQMIEDYEEELRNYDKWICLLVKEYNCTKKTLRPMEMLDNSDYNKIMQWNSKISGMEQVLGLTQEETKKYEEKNFSKE